MKKSQALLLKLANKFQNKYGQSQSLQQILENAAGWGAQSPNGIMNFPAQLKKDQADLTFSVVVSSGMLGGSNIEVTEPRVDPPQMAANYAALPQQIKKFLERHISSFPQIPQGQTVLSYSGKTPDGSGVAQR